MYLLSIFYINLKKRF